MTSTSTAMAISDPQVIQTLQALDLTDTTSITLFGTAEQQKLAKQSKIMIQSVRNKDTGASGEVLGNMMVSLRGLDVSQLEEQQGFWSKLLRMASPAAKFFTRYETVDTQLQAMEDKLMDHSNTLTNDVRQLDVMYKEQKELFINLALYITAGDAKIIEMREVDLPRLQAIADAETDESKQMLLQNDVSDYMDLSTELERQIHNLLLTRSIARQALPKIRMIQKTDTGLIGKINSIINNTLPIWRDQIAIQATVQNQLNTAETTHMVDEATNELLLKGAEDFKTANAKSRRSIERGIVDSSTLQTTNRLLIETIEEGIAIGIQGSQTRQQTRVEDAAGAEELKTALKNGIAASLKAEKDFEG